MAGIAAIHAVGQRAPRRSDCVGPRSFASPPTNLSEYRFTWGKGSWYDRVGTAHPDLSPARTIPGHDGDRTQEAPAPAPNSRSWTLTSDDAPVSPGVAPRHSG